MKKVIFVLLLSFLLVGCQTRQTDLKLEIKLNKGIDTIEVGNDWIDAGCSAFDQDNNVINCEVIFNDVDTSKLGVYSVVYKTTNKGSKKEITRVVTVVDTTKPTIYINEGIDTIIINQEWVDSGASAYDNYDGNLSEQIKVNGLVNNKVIGEYIITYEVSDSSGNKATTKRYVNVVSE